MNLLIHDLTEWCKDMNIKNFREYADIWAYTVHRGKSTHKKLNKVEYVEKMNTRLESKIKELIRFKKKAEKLLSD